MKFTCELPHTITIVYRCCGHKEVFTFPVYLSFMLRTFNKLVSTGKKCVVKQQMNKFINNNKHPKKKKKRIHTSKLKSSTLFLVHSCILLDHEPVGQRGVCIKVIRVVVGEPFKFLWALEMKSFNKQFHISSIRSISRVIRVRDEASFFPRSFQLKLNLFR